MGKLAAGSPAKQGVGWPRGTILDGGSCGVCRLDDETGSKVEWPRERDKGTRTWKPAGKCSRGWVAEHSATPHCRVSSGDVGVVRFRGRDGGGCWSRRMTGR